MIYPEKSPATREEILKLVPGVDGILWIDNHALNGEVLDLGAPTLKAISTMSEAMYHVDIAEFKRRNFPLGYSPAGMADDVAEAAIGLMIAAARRFHEGRLKIESSQWVEGPQWMLGQDVKRKTIGIIGFGELGQAIAKRLKGFEVRRILYSAKNPKPEGDKLGATLVRQSELLKESDFVFLCVPLNKNTRHMINEKTLKGMKPTSVLINVSQGEIVDQDALVTALKNCTIFAAGLDVMTPQPLPADSELLKLPNAGIFQISTMLAEVLMFY